MCVVHPTWDRLRMEWRKMEEDLLWDRQNGMEENGLQNWGEWYEGVDRLLTGAWMLHLMSNVSYRGQGMWEVDCKESVMSCAPK